VVLVGGDWSSALEQHVGMLVSIPKASGRCVIFCSLGFNFGVVVVIGPLPWSSTLACW